MSRGGRGLFLDFDGTLVDSIPFLRRAYGIFLEELGGSPTNDEFDELNGLPLGQVLETLLSRHGLEARSRPEMTSRFLSRIKEAYDSARPMAAAETLLGAARNQGVPVAVVTSSHSALAVAWLERSGLRELVSEVIGGEGLARGKPDPLPYLLALERIGCAADSSLAVEDSPNGARSACAAGLATWIVLAPGRSKEEFPDVRGFVDGLDELLPRLGHSSG